MAFSSWRTRAQFGLCEYADRKFVARRKQAIVSANDSISRWPACGTLFDVAVQTCDRFGERKV